MREFHVGDLIVADLKEGRSIPVGIITDRDIVMATVALGVSPESVYVEDVMSAQLFTAHRTDSLLHVIDLMKKHAVKRIPIIGMGGAIDGIISAEDLLSFLANELTSLSMITSEQRKAEPLRRRNFR